MSEEYEGDFHYDENEDNYKEGLIDIAVKDIIKFVIANKEYFKTNTKALAYVMWKFDRLHNSGRFLTPEQCWSNPKDYVEDEKDGDFSDLMYDAWYVNVSEDGDPYFDEDIENEKIEDPELYRLSALQYKSVDEWIEHNSNPNLRYRLIYENFERFDYLIDLLCGFGSSRKWENGYLIMTGPSNVNLAIFQHSLSEGYQSMSIEIKAQFDSILNRTECIESFETAKKAKFKILQAKLERDKEEVLNFARMIGDDKEETDRLINLIKSGEIKNTTELIKYKDLNDPERKERKKNTIKQFRKKKEILDIDDDCPLMNIPHNAHPSYKKAALEIAKHILTKENEIESNKKIAKNILAKLRKDRLEDLDLDEI